MTHPTSRSRGLFLTAGLIALFGLGMGAYSWHQKSRAADEENAKFRPVRVERGDITLWIQATGTVKPESRLEIKSPIAGRVESVLVREGDSVHKGQVLAWMSSSERAAVLDAAHTKGPAEVAKWEDLYRPTPVLAPKNGTIILRSIEPGQTFASTDSILVLSDRLTVRAQVDETDLAKVRKGLKADVTLDAYPESPIAARVTRVAFEATTVNNVTMYEVDVTPIEISEQMRSGMTASVRFEVASKSDVLLVRNDALQAGGEAILQENGVRTKVPVQTGLTDGKFSEVLAGLHEGDTLLVRQTAPAAKKEQATNPFMPSPPRAGRGRASAGGPPP